LTPDRPAWIKLGGRVFYALAELERFLELCKRGTPLPPAPAPEGDTQQVA
jgi:hypothetical protein